MHSPDIAFDTEGDSLHHSPERLALVQVADVAGDVFLVDPLALPDLSALGAVVADPRVRTLFHAGSNDLVHLKRRHGFTFARMFDSARRSASTLMCSMWTMLRVAAALPVCSELCARRSSTM